MRVSASPHSHTHTHTLTHTLAHRHTQTHAHINTHACMYSRTRFRVRIDQARVYMQVWQMEACPQAQHTCMKVSCAFALPPSRPTTLLASPWLPAGQKTDDAQEMIAWPHFQHVAVILCISDLSKVSWELDWPRVTYAVGLEYPCVPFCPSWGPLFVHIAESYHSASADGT